MINWKRLKVEATLKGRGPGETIKKKNSYTGDITMKRRAQILSQSLWIYSNPNMQH